MKIISEIKVNGKWVNQDELPEEFVHETVEKTLSEAVRKVGFEPVKKKEKTA